jgi:hypothetical protein
MTIQERVAAATAAVQAATEALAAAQARLAADNAALAALQPMLTTLDQIDAGLAAVEVTPLNVDSLKALVAQLRSQIVAD